MTTYDTYQEAKIANPSEVIYTACGNFYALKGRFTVTTSEPLIACNPADHCMTVEKFLADGNKFVGGDLIIGTSGNFVVVGVDYTVGIANMKLMRDNERYILRAAALESQMNIDKLATQTPEEKEVLDSIKPVDLLNYHRDDVYPSNRSGRPLSQAMSFTPMSKLKSNPAIHLRDYQKKETDKGVELNANGVAEYFDLIDTTPHQYEMSKFSGEGEWKNGDVVYDSDGNEITIINTGMIYGLDNTGTYDYWDCGDLCKTKPESPEAKEKREWIEKFAHKVKHVGTMTYKDILGEMYDSLKGESK